MQDNKLYTVGSIIELAEMFLRLHFNTLPIAGHRLNSSYTVVTCTQRRSMPMGDSTIVVPFESQLFLNFEICMSSKGKLHFTLQ